MTREEAGNWALEHWRPSDSDLIEAALAREAGREKNAAIDMAGAYFFGFRVEVIAREGVDPEDRWVSLWRGTAAYRSAHEREFVVRALVSNW